MPGITIEGTYNARWAAVRSTPWLARAAALDLVTDEGITELSRHGFRLVIDLREPGERDRVRHGIPVTSIPLYCLPDGPPTGGSLEDAYDFLLLERGGRLALAVIAIADAAGPVLVHCAAGKDRTGLVVALALLAGGSSRAEVLADYAASADEVAAHRTDHAESTVARLGLTGPAREAAMRLHLDSPATALEHAFATLDSLGGPDHFLQRNGLSDDRLRALRATAMGAADGA